MLIQGLTLKLKLIIYYYFFDIKTIGENKQLSISVYHKPTLNDILNNLGNYIPNPYK